MSQFKLFIDRLKDGQTLPIDESYSPDFLQIHEKELQFHASILVKGQAYLTNDHLILQLSMKTEASMPCGICNNFFSFPIAIEIFTHAEPIEEILSHIFDFAHLVRENILLQVPPFGECHQGACPERKNITKFLKKPSDKAQVEVHYPFTGL